MAAVGKHSVLLFRYTQSGVLVWQSRKIGDLNTADIFHISRVVTVAKNAVGGLADLSRDMTQMRRETLPLRRNSGTVAAFRAASGSYPGTDRPSHLRRSLQQ